MSGPVGIDDLNIYGSTLALDFGALAAARGFGEKELRAVQFIRRSVTPAFEDPVTLAVNAAKPLVDAAGRGSFELLIVATESGVDYGKPLSSYVHRYLELNERCRNLEVKHACYGGTAALQLAASWLRANARAGTKALVVMTDIARRHFKDRFELAAGTGAVALSVAREPRVLALDPHCGYACKETYDVARPTPTGEWNDAVLSLGAYLDLLERSWEQYRSVVGGSISLEEHFRYLLYHTPLVSLIEQAHGVLLQTERDDATATEVRASFDLMVRPSLGYVRELANIYSGSLYAALAGLIDAVPDLEPGARLGLFSYGSGSCAEFYTGRVQEAAGATVGARRIGEALAARRPLDVAAYEALVLESERSLISERYVSSWDLPDDHFDRCYRGRGLLVLQGIEDHYRAYGWS